MEPMIGDGTLQENIKEIFENTVSATKHTHVISKILKDDSFLCSKEADKIEKSIDIQSNKIWSLLRTVLSLCSPETTIKKKDFVGDKIKVLAEINDTILESIHKDIDLAKGIDSQPDLKKAGGNIEKASKVMSWNKNTYIHGQFDEIEPSTSLISTTDPSLLSDEIHTLYSSSNIARPQLKYGFTINNTSAPFIPSMLTRKPHALTNALPGTSSDRYAPQAFVNPYHEELAQLHPSPLWFAKTDGHPKFPDSLESTPLIFISSPDQLDELIDDLSLEDIIAVDLENHSYRSYFGFLCLMQISTKRKDYLLDVFPLWNDMNRLIEVFANPRILKLLHGAAKDVEWLQRDFSLYIVNMFDTFYACEALGLPFKSLAYLLQSYCSVTAKKEFQLADWRVRPLPEALIEYARCDTHYLIYIYECMKNQILHKQATTNPDPLLYPDGLILHVFNRSRRLCQKIYHRPAFGLDFVDSMLRRRNKHFNSKQMFTLKQLNEWRDTMARTEDESPFYVIPNHTMVKLAEFLPKDYVSLLNCCNPVPPLVKQYVQQVHAVIHLSLRNEPLEKYKLSVPSSTSSVVGPLDYYNIAYDNILHCPHDIHPSIPQMDGQFGMPNGDLINCGMPFPGVPFCTTPNASSSQPLTNPADITFHEDSPRSNLYFFRNPLTFTQPGALANPAEPAPPTGGYFKSPFDIFVQSETIKVAMNEQKKSKLSLVVKKNAKSQGSQHPNQRERVMDDVLLADRPSTSAQYASHSEPSSPKQPPPMLAERIHLSTTGNGKGGKNKKKRIRPFDRLSRDMVNPIESYSSPVNRNAPQPSTSSNYGPSTSFDRNVELFNYNSISYSSMLNGNSKNGPRQNKGNKSKKQGHQDNQPSSGPKGKKQNFLIAGQKSNRTKSMTFNYPGPDK